MEDHTLGRCVGDNLARFGSKPLLFGTKIPPHYSYSRLTLIKSLAEDTIIFQTDIWTKNSHAAWSGVGFIRHALGIVVFKIPRRLCNAIVEKAAMKNYVKLDGV